MRIWVQENGELAFLLGLGIGFIFVVFFRLFALLLALAVIAGCLVFTFAPDEAVQAVEPEAEE